MIVVTGAGGFVGRAVTRELARAGAGHVRLVDRELEPDPAFETLSADLTRDGALDAALDGATRVLHLAALPGAAAEADPALSRRVNLDLPLAILTKARGARVVYASSIAVFGDLPASPVDDETPARPNSVYGTHKAMVELAFADAVRRRAIAGVALRLPGIVARPSGSSGFGSAFLSEIFHAARRGDPYVLPVSRQGVSWLMSTQACARILVQALLGEMTAADPVNAPALRVGLGELTAKLAGTRAEALFTFEPQPAIERAFASHPPLTTSRATSLGFHGDSDLEQLIGAALDNA